MHPRTRKACKVFLAKFPDFVFVEWDGYEITAFRSHDPEPFVAKEFILGTATRLAFEEFEEQVCEESPFRYRKP